MDAEFAAGDAVPVIPGCQAHLFEEFVVVGERRQHLEFERDGIVLFQALVKDPLRGAAGRLVHDHGMQWRHSGSPQTSSSWNHAGNGNNPRLFQCGLQGSVPPGLSMETAAPLSQVFKSGPSGARLANTRPVVAVHPRDLLHVGFRLALAETGAAVALLPGDMEQRPVGIEYVTMIAAAQSGHVAATVSHHLRALVGAGG